MIDIKINKTLLQCGMKNNCISDVAFIILKFDEISRKIPVYIKKRKAIPSNLIEKYYFCYKKFSQTFFNHKTVVCLLVNCADKIPKIDNRFIVLRSKLVKFLDLVKNKRLDEKMKSYVTTIKVSLKMLDDFVKKYNKNYKI